MLQQTIDITDLKIMPSKFSDSKVRAFCTATFNHALVVAGIKIMEGKKGIFVTFPITMSGNKPHLIVYPTTKEVGKEIKNRILATYVINHCVDDYTV